MVLVHLNEANYGHKGRPGQRGGSSPKNGGSPNTPGNWDYDEHRDALTKAGARFVKTERAGDGVVHHYDSDLPERDTATLKQIKPGGNQTMYGDPERTGTHVSYGGQKYVFSRKRGSYLK